MREHRSTFKKFLISTALVTGSLCIALIGGEFLLSVFYPPERLWLRVTGQRQVDRELIYSLRPNFSKTGVTINSTGFRGDEVQKKSRDEKRVIILGDSMVFGYKVADQETFPEQLERLYKGEGRQVDVINGGVSGYGTDQAFKLFLTRLQYLEPELVVLSLFSNDIGDNIDSPLYDLQYDQLVPMDPMKNYRYVLGRLPQILPPAVTKSATYYLVASALIGKDIFGVLPDLDCKGLRRWSKRKAILQFSKLQKLGLKDGFRFLVLIIPRRDRVSVENPYRWVHEANLRDVQVLDLSQDPIWDKEEEQLFLEDDVHLSPAGNQLLAAKLFAFIEESRL